MLVLLILAAILGACLVGYVVEAYYYEIHKGGWDE